ncbi:MAG: DNA polymerase, partial [Thermodesulfobacteriota bacterium]
MFPELSHYTRIALDTETDGFDRHGPSKPIGVSISTDKEDWYLRWGHPLGNNCTKEQFCDWAQDALRGKQVSLVNPSFDLHMLRKAGVDLEALNCQPRGVQYRCALLNETRRHYSLDIMGKDYLKRSKLPMYGKLIPTLSGDIVAPYAKQDSRLTYDLDTYFEPLIQQQGLDRVAKLEDDLIYSTLHMELQGVYLDLPKLTCWHAECSALCTRLERELPVNVNSGKQLGQFFRNLGMDTFTMTPAGEPSFTEDALLDYRVMAKTKAVLLAIEDVLRLRQLKSIRDKYLGKYLEEANSDGLLRYNLHQCRTGDNGTVTGRYSSSEVNIQQVSHEDKQSEHTRDWIIRELFLPAPGCHWCSADASQIEFRLFAHYAKAPLLIKAYNEDADTDFHAWVREQTGLNRSYAKAINFMMVYGGGKEKYAREMRVSMDQSEKFFYKYNKKFPEARRLMAKAMRLARSRGYVKTLLGRRRRFSTGDRLYSALNAVLQGSAADLMKL